MNAEKKIKDDWLNDDDVSVSIICITYNQESYIEQTIISLLSQKTSFKFEIIIHDDCSSDKTKEIIKLFENKYPSIIKPIFQHENQYSQGNCVTSIAVNRAKGKYIAICEGDDYWIDENKIQRQFQALEKNTNIDLCIHDAKCVNNNGNESKYSFNFDEYKEGVIDFSSFSRFYTQFSPTASMFCRRNIYLDILNRTRGAPCGDLYQEILLGINKGFYLIPEKMSVYRLGAIGSYSSNNKSIGKAIKYKEKVIDYLIYLKAEIIKECSESDYYHIEKKEYLLRKNLILFYARSKNKNRYTLIKMWIKCFIFLKKVDIQDIKILSSILNMDSILLKIKV